MRDHPSIDRAIDHWRRCASVIALPTPSRYVIISGSDAGHSRHKQCDDRTIVRGPFSPRGTRYMTISRVVGRREYLSALRITQKRFDYYYTWQALETSTLTIVLDEAREKMRTRARKDALNSRWQGDAVQELKMHLAARACIHAREVMRTLRITSIARCS